MSTTTTQTATKAQAPKAPYGRGATYWEARKEALAKVRFQLAA
jgi:hypothetical protein